MKVGLPTLRVHTYTDLAPLEYRVLHGVRPCYVAREVRNSNGVEKESERERERAKVSLVTEHQVLSLFQWRKGKRCVCTGVDKTAEYTVGNRTYCAREKESSFARKRVRVRAIRVSSGATEPLRDSSKQREKKHARNVNNGEGRNNCRNTCYVGTI